MHSRWETRSGAWAATSAASPAAIALAADSIAWWEVIVRCRRFPASASKTLDHAGGETLRISLDEALASPAKVVQLVTWNDYGEGTMIEPTHEFGYRFLEIVQAANRRRLGSAFRSTAADLRLPARLYAARKAAVAPIAALDAVAQAIRSGDGATARAMLDRIDREPPAN